MVRRYSVLGLFVGLILALSLFGPGCKKAEQAKEEAKPAAKVEAQGVTVAEFTFEDEKQKWGGQKNVTVSQSKDQKHAGQSSLKINADKTSGLWNFAGSPNFELIPGKEYRFSGWMLVDSFKAQTTPTFMLKVGIYKEGKWFKNINSKLYNLSKKGEWQLLTGEFIAPSESKLAGNFTVEKRPMDKDVTAIIYVDDIALEKMN